MTIRAPLPDELEVADGDDEMEFNKNQNTTVIVVQPSEKAPLYLFRCSSLQVAVQSPWEEELS